MACSSKPATTQCPSTPATTQCPSTPTGSQCPSTPADKNPKTDEINGTYVVNFNSNGGSESGTPSPQVKTHNKTINLSIARPYRQGYIFMGWATNSTATSALYQPGGTYSANASVVLYAVWKTEANLNMAWYYKDFSSSGSAECAGYVIGRIGEVHGVRIRFNESIDINGVTHRGDGGWWVKNAKSQSDVSILNSDGTITINENSHKNVTVITNPSESNIKSNSAACFLFYVNGYGYFGHVQYIEKIEKINGATQVYYSESNNGGINGSVKIKSYSEFITQFANSKAHGSDKIFQGFIQFD